VHVIALPTLLVVAGMIALSIADGPLALLGDSSPVLMQLGIVLTVVVLGRFISNPATLLVPAVWPF
jgi:hypothetical protein